MAILHPCEVYHRTPVGRSSGCRGPRTLFGCDKALAGLGYGLAYQRSGRIEASILLHFALNAVHFFGFTYPALESAV